MVAGGVSLQNEVRNGPAHIMRCSKPEPPRGRWLPFRAECGDAPEAVTPVGRPPEEVDQSPRAPLSASWRCESLITN